MIDAIRDALHASKIVRMAHEQIDKVHPAFALPQVAGLVI
jgi:hypothetical protein